MSEIAGSPVVAPSEEVIYFDRRMIFIDQDWRLMALHETDEQRKVGYALAALLADSWREEFDQDLKICKEILAVTA